MKGCSTAISEAWAASSTSTFSKAFSNRLKMRRPVLDSVVNTISASCTKDSSRFSCTCNSKECSQAAMQALFDSTTWPVWSASSLLPAQRTAPGSLVPATPTSAISSVYQLNLASVVSIISASCTKDSSRFSCTCNSKECSQAAMQALSTSTTWPDILQTAIDAKMLDSVVNIISASCSKGSSRCPGAAEAWVATEIS